MKRLIQRVNGFQTVRDSNGIPVCVWSAPGALLYLKGVLVGLVRWILKK